MHQRNNIIYVNSFNYLLIFLFWYIFFYPDNLGFFFGIFAKNINKCLHVHITDVCTILFQILLIIVYEYIYYLLILLDFLKFMIRAKFFIFLFLIK